MSFYGSRRSPTYTTTTTGVVPNRVATGHSTQGAYRSSSTGGYNSAHGAHNLTHDLQSRKVSTQVVREEYLDTAANVAARSSKGGVKYVEVPVVEEVITRVPKREVIEIEKYVPKYEYEYVEKVVEVPQVQWVDRKVEVPQFHEVERVIHKTEVVDVPREVIRRVPKTEHVVVEQAVEVPGQIIEVPKPYTVENKIPVDHFVDNEVPMVVAQTIKPMVTESDEVVEVDVYEYEPEYITVDVEVPKAVPLPVLDYGVTEERHRVVQVPPAQYNSMLRMLNSRLAEVEAGRSLPYVREGDRVPFLSSYESSMAYPAPKSAQIEGWTPKVPYSARGHQSSSRGVHHRYSRRPLERYYPTPSYPATADPYSYGNGYEDYAYEDPRYYSQHLYDPRGFYGGAGDYLDMQDPYYGYSEYEDDEYGYPYRYHREREYRSAAGAERRSRSVRAAHKTRGPGRGQLKNKDGTKMCQCCT